MTRRDVVVVGAGPAGAVAALTLAAGGRSVALLERERLPRYKACGGGVVERALADLPCRRPTPADFPMVPVRRLVVHCDGGDPVSVERGEPPITMVLRSDFDRFLVDRAREEGADLFQGAAVTHVRREGEEFVCRTGSMEYRSAFLVGADGAESRVSRLLRAGRPPRLGVALEAELSVGEGGGPSDGAVGPEARFDFSAVPGGYGWVFPKAGGLSAGIFSRRPRHPALREAYRAYAHARGLPGPGMVQQRLTGHRIPVAPHRTRGRGGLLLAGDAAGLADPLTGEGISFAIRSGRLAGQAVLHAGGEPSRAGAAYEDLLSLEVIPEIRAARLLAAILYGAPALAYRVFSRTGRAADAVVDVFSGRRTYADLLGRTLRRPWRLLG